jgi:trigger factor
MVLQKEIKKEPNAKISIQVTVDKASVNEAKESIIQDFERSAKIPGFRKGKVPRNMVLTRFSKNIKDETISRVLSDSLRQILKEDKYRPISEPVVTEIGDLTFDEDFSYKAEFDVMPEVKLGEYKGIESEKYVYKVSAKKVTEELDALRERFATLLSVDKKAEIGNYLVIDHEEITDTGERKNKKEEQTVLLDSETDSFGKQLVGLKKGDEKELTVDAPYVEEGKEKTRSVRLHVSVKDVKKKELPVLDNDFAKDISDVDTVEELKTSIKDKLKKDAKQRSEDKTREELVNKVIEKTSFELPETLVNNETNRIISEIASMYRMDLKKMQENEKSYLEYRKNLRPRAINNLKYELVLDEIARKEKIEVRDKEVDEEIKKYAENGKKDFQTIKNSMIENKNIENLRYRIKLGKASELLYKNAKLEKIKNLNYGDEEGKG